MTINIPALAKELAEAQADLDLLGRLQGAAKRVEAIQKQYDAAVEEQGQREAAAEAAAYEAQFEGLVGVRVEETPDRLRPGNVIASSFKIIYTQLEYNMYLKECRPKESEVVGFKAVPAHVLRYLLEKCPENIPDSIMGFCPDDPHQAYVKYAQAKHRGWA